MAQQVVNGSYPEDGRRGGINKAPEEEERDSRHFGESEAGDRGNEEESEYTKSSDQGEDENEDKEDGKSADEGKDLNKFRRPLPLPVTGPFGREPVRWFFGSTMHYAVHYGSGTFTTEEMKRLQHLAELLDSGKLDVHFMCPPDCINIPLINNQPEAKVNFNRKDRFLAADAHEFMNKHEANASLYNDLIQSLNYVQKLGI